MPSTDAIRRLLLLSSSSLHSSFSSQQQEASSFRRFLFAVVFLLTVFLFSGEQKVSQRVPSATINDANRLSLSLLGEEGAVGHWLSSSAASSSSPFVREKLFVERRPTDRSCSRGHRRDSSGYLCEF
jgi:hypothetical protein